MLFEAITHLKIVSKKKPIVKLLLAHINHLGTINWYEVEEVVVEETPCILRTKGIINEAYKILATSDTNTIPSLLLLLESQFLSSNSATPIIHFPVISVTPTLHSKENSNPNQYNLKNDQIQQLNAELRALKSFIME